MSIVTQTTDFKVKAGVIVAGTSTVSSSTGQTGTLQVNGGAAISKNLIVGTTSDFYGDSKLYSNFYVTGTSFLSDVTINGITTSTNTATATGFAQGSLVLQGGAYVGDNLIVMSTASSTATGLNNALYVDGGFYAKTGLTSEGPALFKDTVVFNGTATYVFSTNTFYTDNILELHIPPGGIDDVWSIDDGKDIGIRIRYYDDSNKNAAFVFANDTKQFEFYKSGAEGTSTFTNGVYGGIKAGSLWLVDTTATSNTFTGALIVQGGAGIAGDIYVGESVSANSLTARNLTDTRLVIAGFGGQLYDYATLTFNTSTNIIQGRITTATNSVFANTATNLAGGTAGALVYQTDTGSTNFITLGTATYILTSNGAEPFWAPTGSAATASTATNIEGGQTGQIPFQSAPGQTTFSSTLTYKVDSGTLEVNGGSTASGHIAASGDISSSSTVFTNYLRVSNNTNSTGTATGAVTIVGGVGIGQNLHVGGDITVGVITTNSNVSLLNGNNLNLSSYTKTGISGSGLINLDTYSGSDYRSSKYFIQIVDGTDVHVTEMSVFHDGTDSYKTEYGYHYNNGSLGSFNAIYTASNVIVTFLPAAANNMTIKIVRWSITS
jgi:hypothetical protein